MTDKKWLENALSLLERGSMEKAQLGYGEALKKEPSNLEFQCGFYGAGWWHNRAASYSSLKKGRPLAAWLMSEWEKFSAAAEQRHFLSCLSFRAVMRRILEDAVDNFRIAFQKEGTSSVDTSLLKQLGICLIQLEDYQNAADILNYARKKNNRDAIVYFLLGESLCCLNDNEMQERGLGYFRDAMLIDLHSIPLEFIKSELSSHVFQQLLAAYNQKLEPTLNWFPAYMMARYFLPGIRPLESKEVSYINSEIARLSQNMKNMISKYRERVLSGLSFYILIMIHHYRFHNSQRAAETALQERLQDLSPELYAFFCQHEGKAR